MSLAELTHGLVDRYSPEVDVPPPAVLDQVRRNAQLRTSLLQEFGAISVDELADLVGSRATKRRTTIDNWVRADRVVAVVWHGRSLVPGFQLLPDGRPDRLLQPALRALHTHGAGAWERALWWTVPARLLDGARPVDVLLRARDAAAAERASVAERLERAASRRRDWT